MSIGTAPQERTLETSNTRNDCWWLQLSKNVVYRSSMTPIFHKWMATKSAAQTTAVVKKHLKKCVHCKHQSGKPFALPVSPPLPVSRVMDAKPFTVTGAHFNEACLSWCQRIKSEGKAYMCLFTCATTRVIYVEVVTDLTTGTFHRAFQRFAAWRSLPSLMLPDNASTWHWETDVGWTRLSISGQTLSWVALHTRTYFMVQRILVMKIYLKKELGHAHITLDELTTIITEVEATFNDWPIPYMSD